jgi:hypothetical protein
MIERYYEWEKKRQAVEESNVLDECDDSVEDIEDGVENYYNNGE